MARWKLTQPHYLKVPGTKWEYIENSVTGRPVRKTYDVPKYLHPEDPGDWNEVTERDQRGVAVAGNINVCWPGKGHGNDIEFSGPPTPDMVPIDEEGKLESSKLVVGADFANQMPEGGYAGRVLEDLTKKLAEAMTNQNSPAPQMDKLIETLGSMMEQNAKLLSALGERAVGRRV